MTGVDFYTPLAYPHEEFREWAVRQDLILMLLAYGKAERDDLTPRQLKLLRRVVEEEFK